LRDQPVWFNEAPPTDGARGTISATSQPFRLQRAPVVPNSATAVTAPGGPWTIDFDDSPDVPAAGHVNIKTDTGEVIFPAAPAVGTLAVTYQSVRFGDPQVLDALTEGLNMLFPEIWNPNVDSTSIPLSPVQLEYALPLIFRDQRVTITDVELQPPSGILRSYRTSQWRGRADTLKPTLIFTSLKPAGQQMIGTCVISYSGPFSTLAQVPTIAQYLPVYYAIAKLLMDQEVMRGRSDDLPAQTGENASPAGGALNTASYWMERFYFETARLNIGEPARRLVTDRAVERLGLSTFWQISG